MKEIIFAGSGGQGVLTSGLIISDIAASEGIHVTWVPSYGSKAGGNVTGVEPNFFIENEFQHDGLTKLIVTKDMSERKNKMIELGEAFIAFPGGTGTLEEIAEVMSNVSLKHLEAPCILYNLNGYYDDLKALLNHMIEKGLSSNERQEGIFFVENLDDIKRILRRA